MKTIEANEIVLVDKEGKRRLLLSTAGEENSAAHLIMATGVQTQLSLRAAADGHLTLEFQHSDGSLRLALNMTPQGGAALTLFGEKGIPSYQIDSKNGLSKFNQKNGWEAADL